MKGSLKINYFAVKLLWIIKGIFFPKNKDHRESRFYEMFVERQNATPSTAFLPLFTSTQNIRMSVGIFIQNQYVNPQIFYMQLFHRKIKEAYQLLLSKSQPPNPLPRKVWKQRDHHSEGSVAGPRPGAGPYG